MSERRFLFLLALVNSPAIMAVLAFIIVGLLWYR